MKLNITVKPASMKGALLVRPGYAEKLRAMTRKATFVAATKAHKHMTMRIRVPKSGHTYKVGKRRVHVASAPYESPANNTGNLIGSIDHVQIPDAGGIVSSIVEVRAPYGKYLEYGTKKMAPRPFVRPTRDYIAPVFKDYIVEKLRKLNKDGVVS